MKGDIFMVSGLTIGLLVLQFVVCLGLPVGFFIFYKVRNNIHFQSVGGGALVFVVFALILERILHTIVLKVNPVTAAFFKNPFAYAIYGAAAAALFEECGRFCAYKTILKKYHRWQDGIAYGIGHGGFEMLFIGALGALSTMITVVSINGGAYFPDTVLKAIQAPAYQLDLGLGIYERCIAFFSQIGMSLVVLYGVANHKNRFLLYSILLHMGTDFFAALGQVGVLSMWTVELSFLPFGVLGIILIIKAKKIFAKGVISGERAVISV